MRALEKLQQKCSPVGELPSFRVWAAGLIKNPEALGQAGHLQPCLPGPGFGFIEATSAPFQLSQLGGLLEVARVMALASVLTAAPVGRPRCLPSIS